MIRGILDTSEAANYGVLMAETDNHWERVGSASSSMRTRRVDGLLVGMQRARHVDLPFGPDTPPTIIVNGTADGHRHVLPDEYIAGLDSVRYLVERGHRRIGLIGQSAAFQDVRLSATVGRRIAGIERGMADAGLNPAYVVEGSEWEPELGHEGALQILRDSEATAIVAANGRIAFGVYQAVQEEGLMVGRDISVLSFGGEALASYLRPRVTTTRLPYQEMGRIAAEMLIARIKGEPGSDEQPQETLVPMPLIERDSVRDLR
jgi:LacI family transcriptional regulator